MLEAQSRYVGKGQMRLAVSYAEAGYPVHPIHNLTKRPLTRRSFYDATSDLNQVVAWWEIFPSALVGIPTGDPSKLVVLDVDGADGIRALKELLKDLNLERLSDLTTVVSKTPGGGLHLYFRHRPDTSPKSRASDIRKHLDSRGLGGYIIAMGNVLRDGRGYFLYDTSRGSIERQLDPICALRNVPNMPMSLLFAMTFNARERVQIGGIPKLGRKLEAAEPEYWLNIVSRYQSRPQIPTRPVAIDAMRRQAEHDLNAIYARYSSEQDGRRIGLFRCSCAIAKYVAHGVLSADEVQATLIQAARNNGALGKYGKHWAENQIRAGVRYGQTDSLPKLAKPFTRPETV